MSHLKDIQSSLVATLKAQSLAAEPYMYEGLPISRPKYVALAASHNDSVRLFYLRRYLDPSKLQPLITQVPAVCIDGDRYITAQSGQAYGSLRSCRAAHPDLISNAQRRLSRNKCVASFVTVLAQGGYHSSFVPLEEPDFFDCAVVSGAGPQFEAAHLDFADLFLTKDPAKPDNTLSARLPEYKKLSAAPPGEWLDVLAKARLSQSVVAVCQNLDKPLSALPAYVRFEDSKDAVMDAQAFVATMKETLHLWLSAFDALVKSRGDGAKGYFKLVSIGTGFFATLPYQYGGTNVGNILQPLLLRCTLDLLGSGGDETYPCLHVIEFPDFSGRGLYSPPVGEVGHVKLLAGPNKDVLDFPKDVREGKDGWVPGVLNPGDCFALVGNERGHGSVEAMIGCNSTLRYSQNYIWNEHVLDQQRWEGVDV